MTQGLDAPTLDLAVAFVREGQSVWIDSRIRQPHKIVRQAIPRQYSQAFAVGRGQLQDVGF